MRISAPTNTASKAAVILLSRSRIKEPELSGVARTDGWRRPCTGWAARSRRRTRVVAVSTVRLPAPVPAVPAAARGGRAEQARIVVDAQVVDALIPRILRDLPRANDWDIRVIVDAHR